MSLENKFKDDELEKIRGGQKNSGNSFSFKRGLKVYSSLDKLFYYLVGKDYSNIKDIDQVCVALFRSKDDSSVNQEVKYMLAGTLQKHIDQFGTKND